jgi:hypothetical protein
MFPSGQSFQFPGKDLNSPHVDAHVTCSGAVDFSAWLVIFYTPQSKWPTTLGSPLWRRYSKFRNSCYSRRFFPYRPDFDVPAIEGRIQVLTLRGVVFEFFLITAEQPQRALEGHEALSDLPLSSISMSGRRCSHALISIRRRRALTAISAAKSA